MYQFNFVFHRSVNFGKIFWYLFGRFERNEQSTNWTCCVVLSTEAKKSHLVKDFEIQLIKDFTKPFFSFFADFYCSVDGCLVAVH